MATNYKLAEAREKAGLTQQELAERVGVSQQAIQYYESGERDIRSSMVLKLSEALDCSPTYILGLDDAPWIKHIRLASAEDFVDVPLYGSIAAGTPIEMIETDDMHPIPSEMHRRYPDAFLLRVKGESMNRVLPDGCYALVNPCSAAEEDGRPYAVCVNGYDATIKRVHVLNNGFELVPDSNDPTYKPTVYDYGVPGTETITVIGRVVWFCIPYDWGF